MTILKNALERIKKNQEEYIRNTTKSCIEKEKIIVSEIMANNKIYNELTEEMSKNIPPDFQEWDWVLKGGEYFVKRDSYAYRYFIKVPDHIRYSGMIRVPISLMAWDLISAYSECGYPSLVYEDFICVEDAEPLKEVLNKMLSSLL